MSKFWRPDTLRQQPSGTNRKVQLFRIRQIFLTTFSEEETEKLISPRSEEKVLFNSQYKNYFKRDLRQNSTNHI